MVTAINLRAGCNFRQRTTLPRIEFGPEQAVLYFSGLQLSHPRLQDIDPEARDLWLVARGAAFIVPNFCHRQLLEALLRADHRQNAGCLSCECRIITYQVRG